MFNGWIKFLNYLPPFFKAMYVRDIMVGIQIFDSQLPLMPKVFCEKSILTKSINHYGGKRTKVTTGE